MSNPSVIHVDTTAPVPSHINYIQAMSDMNLTETVRSYLRVKDGTESVTIYGEALLRDYESPDFVLHKNSIEKWDPPNEKKK